MANVLYPIFKNSLLLSTAVSMTSDHRKILIDSADYTFNAAHDFLADVAVGARVATSGALGSPTVGSVAAGVYDHADVIYATVTGDPVEAIIEYQHTGTDGTSELVSFLDTGIGNFPMTPNGGQITLQMNASGVIALTDS